MDIELMGIEIFGLQSLGTGKIGSINRALTNDGTSTNKIPGEYDERFEEN